MRKYITIIAVLLLTALNSNAQYSLMTRGERCPFDSAVAIRLDVYRLESLKMKLADRLIFNLSYQMKSLEAMNINLHSQLSLSDQKFRLKEEEVNVKQQTINELLKQMAYKPEKSWWEKNQKPVLFIGGVAVGIGGVVLIMNLIN